MTDWDKMREELSSLTKAELFQIARDEHITLGTAAARKESTVAEIVTWRRCRELEAAR